MARAFLDNDARPLVVEKATEAEARAKVASVKEVIILKALEKMRHF
jgi:hypothetical protein